MKQVTINCEFSLFLTVLTNEADSEKHFEFAKDNLYTYRRDEHGCEYEDEITEEELMALYHESVEIQLLEIGKHYGCEYCDLGLTFHSQNDLQFALCCWKDLCCKEGSQNFVFTTFKTLQEVHAKN